MMGESFLKSDDFNLHGWDSFLQDDALQREQKLEAVLSETKGSLKDLRFSAERRYNDMMERVETEAAIKQKDLVNKNQQLQGALKDAEARLSLLNISNDKLQVQVRCAVHSSITMKYSQDPVKLFCLASSRPGELWLKGVLDIPQPLPVNRWTSNII